MGFEQDFINWLNQGLKADLPSDIKAFSFNLFESASVDGVKFGVELIGASFFDEDDPDWACDEVWEPIDRQLNIPAEYSSENWEICLEKIKNLVIYALNNEKGDMLRLKRSEGIGVGFVDGDLQIVWKS